LDKVVKLVRKNDLPCFPFGDTCIFLKDFFAHRIIPLCFNRLPSVSEWQSFRVVAHKKKEKPKPCAIVSVRVSEINQQFPRKLQKAKKVLVFQRFKCALWDIIKPPAVRFNLVNVQQVGVNLPKNFGLRINTNTVWDK